MKRTTSTIAILLSALLTANAQSIQERIMASDLVIEGKVIQTKSYWNSARTQIYTSNLIEVYKIFKGETTSGQVEIITQGGTVGDAFRIAFHTLQLKNGMEGVFFCKATNSPSNMQGFSPFEAYGEEAGFIRFYSEPYNPVASDNHTVYNSVEVVFEEIELNSPQRTIIIKEAPTKKPTRTTPPKPTIEDPTKSMGSKDNHLYLQEPSDNLTQYN